MLELYDHPLSPYGFKIRILLYEKGVEFEKHEIHTESQRAELLDVNPRGEVPALRDGETVVADSKVIGEYVEERHPVPPLLPTDLGARARARRIELFADGPLDASTLMIALFKVFRPGLAETHASAVDAAAALHRKRQEELDRELEGREYFVDTFSRADVAVAPHVIMAAAIGHGVPPELANLTAWLARMNERPSVQRTTNEALAAFAAQQEEKEPFFSNDRLHWRSDRIEALVKIGLGAWLLEDIEKGGAFLPD